MLSQKRGRAFTTDAAHPHSRETPHEGVREVEKVVKDVATLPVGGAVAVRDDFGYGDDAAVGKEDVRHEDLPSPFVRIIDAKSAQCDESKPAYDPEVRPGMIYHRGLNRYFPRETGFGFVVSMLEHSYTEFVPVDNGGGFRGKWDINDPRAVKLKTEQGAFKKLQTTNPDDPKEGTELIETHSAYGIFVPRDKDGTWLVNEATEGVIAFTSMQISKFRDLSGKLTNGSARGIPIFAWKWNFTAKPEKNKKGSYYGWKIDFFNPEIKQCLLPKTDPLYLRARDVRNLLESGQLKVDFGQSGAATDDGTTERNFTGQTIDQTATHEEEIPF